MGPGLHVRRIVIKNLFTKHPHYTYHLYETSRHLMMFCAFNKWYSWVQSALYEIQLYVQSGCNLYNYITAPCLSVTNTTLLYYLDTTFRTLNALVGLWTLTKWYSFTLPHLIQDPIPWAKPSVNLCHAHFFHFDRVLTDFLAISVAERRKVR